MGRVMNKNLWQKERKNIFRHLVKQYHGEGYSYKESKKLAKQEMDEIMEDKENFINTLWKESFNDS